MRQATERLNAVAPATAAGAAYQHPTARASALGLSLAIEIQAHSSAAVIQCLVVAELTSSALVST